MKTLVVKNTRLTRNETMDFGWGNGYVLIPKGHKLHGVHYDDIDVRVHGGLTFSELVSVDMARRMNIEPQYIGFWCVGFDTCHLYDTLDIWSKEAVEDETEKLREQLEKILPISEN